MSGETTLTGRHGKHVVEDTLVARITQWDVSSTLASKSEWGDSDSAGYTNRTAGRRDATFETQGKYDTTDEQFDLFVPGDISESSLWMASTPSGLYWAFPRALCSDFKMTVNVESEEVIGWESSWGADGIFYRPGEAGAPTLTLPT